MKVYTLKETKTGGSACLNGKLFKVKKDDKGRAVFVDIITDKVIWVTAEIQEKLNTNYGVRFTTKRGSTYELVNVLSLIPTTTASKEVVIEGSALRVVRKEETSKAISYGDGYNKTEFEFNFDITEDEFIKYLLTNGYKIYDQQAWYEDHSEISGSGRNWVYKWVRVYTD